MKFSPHRFLSKFPLPNRGLHFRFLITFLSISLLPLLLYALMNYHAATVSLANAAHHSLKIATLQIADSLDSFIGNNLELIGTQARLKTLKETLKKPSDPELHKAALDILLSFCQRDPVFISCYALIDSSGKVIADTLHPISSPSTIDHTFSPSLNADLPTVSDIEFLPKTGQYSLCFSSPIIDPSTSRLLGFLQACYNATILQQFLSNHSVPISDDAYPILISQRHQLLAHGKYSDQNASPLLFRFIEPTHPDLSPSPALPLYLPEISPLIGRLESFHSASSSHPIINSESNSAITVSRLKSRPWYVFSVQPRDTFLTPIRDQLKKSIFFFGAVTLIVVAVALWTAHFLSRPIIRLTQAAARVANGSLQPIPPFRAPGEIGLLARVFNQMLDQLRNREAEQKKSINEKEILLKEIHHRVKNNLQVVCSLLNLQSAYVKNPEDVILFQESHNRVRSMSLVHEKLYQDNLFTGIRFESYIRDLVSHLAHTYSVKNSRVQIHLEVQDLKIPIDMAIPCSLILNELISNAFKYAFPDNREGCLTIHLSQDPKGDTLLFVKDNGVGLPAGVDLQRSSTLGLQLISGLARQLHSTVEVSRTNGTCFTFRWNTVSS